VDCFVAVAPRNDGNIVTRAPRISRHVNDIAGVRGMVNKTGRILTPARAVDQPHPNFLRWHRENCFKA
jgi:hypothetical protein